MKNTERDFLVPCFLFVPDTTSISVVSSGLSMSLIFHKSLFFLHHGIISTLPRHRQNGFYVGIQLLYLFGVIDM